MFVNIGVSTVGQPGVSGVMLALQMAGFEVTAFDADRVYVNVEVRSWMGYDLEQAMQSAVELTKDALTLFPELKSLKVTAYGEALDEKVGVMSMRPEHVWPAPMPEGESSSDRLA